ncbi:signal peptidase I [Shuttleworthella satelles]|uniref:Signal peptidase I n=1 Tax=Shuttleworthella satelles DSM 14600 TaxID=626523 RepID=C4GAZ9_9FIRM|nr:signal peptidase I [Shuttleworthia satelles]EEP28292.1 signal peptidase I [Shuttleworthia satelles DSM 14600]
MEEQKRQETIEKRQEKNPVREVLSTILYLALVILAAYLIVTFVGQRTEVNGSSMENTLDNGDNLIVDKISYRLGSPKRFDIVVFPYPQNPSTYFIKRVIGLPGETVRIDSSGKIYINGQVLEENFGREVISNPGLAQEPIKLGEDQYFVLGDNRNNSMDSRDSRVGLISGKSMVGKAFLRIWPLNKFGLVRHSM